MSSISCKTKSARLRQFLRKRCCPIPNCLDTPQPSTTSNLSQEIFAFADPVIYIYDYYICIYEADPVHLYTYLYISHLASFILAPWTKVSEFSTLQGLPGRSKKPSKGPTDSIQPLWLNCSNCPAALKKTRQGCENVVPRR